MTARRRRIPYRRGEERGHLLQCAIRTVGAPHGREEDTNPAAMVRHARAHPHEGARLPSMPCRTWVHPHGRGEHEVTGGRWSDGGCTPTGVGTASYGLRGHLY
jgi:hypothetical protein